MAVLRPSDVPTVPAVRYWWFWPFRPKQWVIPTWTNQYGQIGPERAPAPHLTDRCRSGTFPLRWYFLVKTVLNRGIPPPGRADRSRHGQPDASVHRWVSDNYVHSVQFGPLSLCFTHGLSQSVENGHLRGIWSIGPVMGI